MAQAADWPLPTLRAPRLSSCWRQVSCSRSETASRSRKAAGFPPPDRLEPEALPAPFGDWQRLEKRRSPDLHAARGATAPGRIEGMCKAGQHLAAGTGPCRQHAGGNPMPGTRVDNSDKLNMIRHPNADPLQSAMIVRAVNTPPRPPPRDCPTHTAAPVWSAPCCTSRAPVFAQASRVCLTGFDMAGDVVFRGGILTADDGRTPDRKTLSRQGLPAAIMGGPGRTVRCGLPRRHKRGSSGPPMIHTGNPLVPEPGMVPP